MLRSVLKCVWFGFVDSFRGFYIAFKLDHGVEEEAKKRKTADTSQPPRSILELRRRQEKKHEQKATTEEDIAERKPSVWRKILFCIFSNVACVLGVYLLGGAMWSESEETSEPSVLSLLFHILGVLPYFVFTRLVNAIWFQDIANAALRHSGRRPVAQPLSALLADVVMGVFLEVVFLCQSLAVPYVLPVPLVGQVLGLVHMTMLYSLYSFEYNWISSGVKLSRRVQRLETDWPYYMGFGLPLTLLAWQVNSIVVNGCIFGALFPFFLISSYQANPPVTDFNRPPSLHLFAPSLFLCNKISLSFVSRLQPSFVPPS